MKFIKLSKLRIDGKTSYLKFDEYVWLNAEWITKFFSSDENVIDFVGRITSHEVSMISTKYDVPMCVLESPEKILELIEEAEMKEWGR